MEKTDCGYQTIINGTTFQVVLASNEGAKQTFEELIKDCIQQEAEALPPDKCA